MPVAKISSPFTSNEMPIKNQIEMDPPDFITPHQKTIFRAVKITPTTTAQNHGRRSVETMPSEGISVKPYTSPFNSASGFGLVTRLTATVTSAHTMQDHSARYIFSAMSRAYGESAT